jgi:23S rRNA pseudouridine2604 synthase
MENLEYPMRINKYLALKGYCGRREADTFIERGLVQINGKRATLGQKVEEKDKVEVLGKLKRLGETYAYYIFNKPFGVAVDDEDNDTMLPISEIFPTKEKVVPVGRLDKDSDGLLLLTNDKRVIKKILEPEYEHEKEYIVNVDKPIIGTVLTKLAKGVDIEGYITKPAKTHKIDERLFSIILTEGKKHQVRRMCAAVGYQVKRLRRVRIMHLKLGELRKGEGRPLNDFERNLLLKKTGLA